MGRGWGAEVGEVDGCGGWLGNVILFWSMI